MIQNKIKLIFKRKSNKIIFNNRDHKLQLYIKMYNKVNDNCSFLIYFIYYYFIYNINL